MGFFRLGSIIGQDAGLFAVVVWFKKASKIRKVHWLSAKNGAVGASSAAAIPER